MDTSIIAGLAALAVAVVLFLWVLNEVRGIHNQLRYANWLAHKRLTEHDHPGVGLEPPPH